MKAYFDSSFLMNPLYDYLRWLAGKCYYQLKYWGRHLRIGYKANISQCIFGNYNYIGKYVILGCSTIGDYSYVSRGCVITHTRIGKFCSVGPDVKIAPGRHPSSKIVSTHPSIFSNPSFLQKSFANMSIYEGNKEVNIGNDVWIGANCVILDGVTIADGAIVGANSVVTKDVEAYSIVGGVPARLIRKRFQDTEAERLLAFKWWDKDADWLKLHIHAFADISQFMKL
jgi:acetyltransferase-like isoleucine patch superfamily enzyme